MAGTESIGTSAPVALKSAPKFTTGIPGPSKSRSGSNKARPASSRSKPETGVAGELDLGNGASVEYLPAHLGDKAEDIFTRLDAEVEWQQCDVRIMGRMVPQPRLVAYYASDATRAYTYSGLRLEAKPLSPLLLELKEAVEKVAGESFDSILLNKYRDGSDHVGWHADNEKLYGDAPTIASLSLGGARDFQLRSNADHERKITYALGGGDVFVMRGSTQAQWQHCIPKRAPADQYGVRISLTFRRILHPEAVEEQEHPHALRAAAAALSGGSNGVAHGAGGVAPKRVPELKPVYNSNSTSRAPRQGRTVVTAAPAETGEEVEEAGRAAGRGAPMYVPKSLLDAAGGSSNGNGSVPRAPRARPPQNSGGRGAEGRRERPASSRGRGRGRGSVTAGGRGASGGRGRGRGPVENPLLVPAVTEAAVSAAAAALSSRPPEDPVSAADAAGTALKGLAAKK